MVCKILFTYTERKIQMDSYLLWLYDKAVCGKSMSDVLFIVMCNIRGKTCKF